MCVCVVCVWCVCVCVCVLGYLHKYMSVVPCSILYNICSFQYMQHKSFYRKLAKSLQLDAGTAEILSGEFAEEAILVKAEQLTRHEVSNKSISCVHVPFLKKPNLSSLVSSDTSTGRAAICRVLPAAEVEGMSTGPGEPGATRGSAAEEGSFT